MTVRPPQGFPERLAAARGRFRITLRDISEACDCTPQAVKRWEDGKAMPDSRRFLALCSLLDVSAEWLFCPDPLDFHSTEDAPQGRHAKYWVRAALAELADEARPTTQAPEAV